jgi:hypothetical protein
MEIDNQRLSKIIYSWSLKIKYLVLTTTNYPKAKNKNKIKVGNLKWPFLMLNGYQKEKMITNNSQENFKNM